MERGEPLGPDDPGDGPLFLDDLAISHLEGAGLLEQLRRSTRTFRVHPNLVHEVDLLIATEADTAQALDVLDRLRVWVRDSLATDKVRFMPRVRHGDAGESIKVRTLQELVANVTDSDAILIDDRMSGAQGRVIDRTGQTVPILDVFELLNELTRTGALTPEQKWLIHHRLRCRGFVCVPLEVDELEHLLRSREPEPDGSGLRESAELRAIRENLQRLRSTTILRQPAETPYLDRLRMVGLVALRNTCQDQAVPIPTAIARIEWIWRHVIPSPIDWAHTITHMAGVVPPPTGLANLISALLLLGGSNRDRRQAFRNWVETQVVEPLEIASSDVLQAVAAIARSRIREWVDEHTSNA